MTESHDEHNTRISIKITLFLMYSGFSECIIFLDVRNLLELKSLFSHISIDI